MNALAVANQDRTGLIEIIDVADTMSEVRAEGDAFLHEERAWLAEHNPFLDMQLKGYGETAIRSIGGIGIAAVKGVLVANRIVQHMVGRGVLDYEEVKAFQVYNLPIAVGPARAQLSWMPNWPMTDKAESDAAKIFVPEIVAALDVIQTPPMHVGCVSGLMISLLDTRDQLRRMHSIGR